jgi:uncharacterized protein YndB with AHSA1/START domain
MDLVAEVEVNRPAREVFDYLADAENMPRWMKVFTAVEKVSDGPIGQDTEFRYQDKRGTDSTFSWSDFQPPGRLAWRGKAVKALPGGSIETNGHYDIHEHDGHTHVLMHMQPQLHGTAKVLGPMLSRSIRKSSDEYVQLLKHDLEQ